MAANACPVQRAGGPGRSLSLAIIIVIVILIVIVLVLVLVIVIVFSNRNGSRRAVGQDSLQVTVW